MFVVESYLGNWFVFRKGEQYAVCLCCKESDARLVCAALNSGAQPPQADNTQSKTLPLDIKEKFLAFVASQKDIPSEFAQVINDNFWDLI
jgi:hypothetical protein